MLSLAIALAVSAEPQGPNDPFKMYIDSIVHPPYVAACSSIFSKYPNLTELLETELKSWEERHNPEIEAGSKIASDKGFTPGSAAFEMAKTAALRGAEELKRKGAGQAEYCDSLIRELRR